MGTVSSLKDLITSYEEQPSSMSESEQNDLLLLRMVLVVDSVVCASMTLASALLVAGAVRRSARLVMTFTVGFGISILLLIVTWVVGLCDPAMISKLGKDLKESNPEYVPDDGWKWRLALAGMMLPLLAFFLYLWLVVFSFYRELTGAVETTAGQQAIQMRGQAGCQAPVV